MTTMVIDDLKPDPDFLKATSYFAVIGDLASKIQLEIERHRAIDELCGTLDAMTEVVRTAKSTLETEFSKVDHLILPVELEVVLLALEKMLKESFEKSVKKLNESRPARYDFIARSQHKKVIDKMNDSLNVTLDFLALFSQFASADEWDVELYMKAQSGELAGLLKQNSFTLTENDWKQFELSLSEDREPSPHVKRIAKDYHNILSA